MTHRRSLARTLQANTDYLYAFTAAALLIWAPITTPQAIAAVMAGAAAVWISSGVWQNPHRWAARVQVTFVAVLIAGLLSSRPEPDLAAAGLLVMGLAVVLGSGAHRAAITLRSIQGSLVTVRGFARVEGLASGLYAATFAAPILIGISPGLGGVLAAATISITVGALAARKARRRLNRGIARLLLDEVEATDAP